MTKYLNRESNTILSKRKAQTDNIVRFVFFLLALLCSASVIFILLFIIYKGLSPFFSDYIIDGIIYRVDFFSFITGTSWSGSKANYGAGFIMVNTLYIAFWTTLLSTPISILTALVVVRMSNKYIGKIITFAIELLASIPQGLIVINNEGKIILINKSGEQILSTSLQLAKSKPLVNFFKKKEVLYIVDKAKNQNISVYKEYKSGNNRDYKINIYSLYNEAGNDVCLVFNDVTQEKILSKSKRDFFANASHELKSPLTTIKGYIQLIKENIITDDKEKARTFERVISEANRMNDIIIQMLDLSKLEVTKPIISEEISCLEMVDEACSMLEKKRLDKAISLKISGSDFKIKLMREDALSLVKNIVENAILYNKQNGIININLNQNTLSISDTGIGIPVKYQKRIFERFFRVDKAKSRKMGGTGLGLSIVKHICINYNLHLKLKSQLNIGTCITVDF